MMIMALFIAIVLAAILGLFLSIIKWSMKNSYQILLAATKLYWGVLNLFSLIILKFVKTQATLKCFYIKNRDVFSVTTKINAVSMRQILNELEEMRLNLIDEGAHFSHYEINIG